MAETIAGGDVRLGIDVGGTFTDAVLWQEDGSAMAFAKVPSTPGSFADGVLEAARQVLQEAGVPASAVTHLVHGSTVAANVVAEKRGAKVGLLTTLGFRDVLELQRNRRDALYNLYYEKPRTIVPRYLRLELPERIGPSGEVLQALDEAACRDAVRRLKAEGCEAIAVVLLFSFQNPAHERRAHEIICEEYPEAYTSLSSVVNPEFREYERTSTTVIDAYVKPEVTAYYEDLGKRLKHECGIGARLDVIQSGGGVMSVADAAAKPAHTIESGPAAGAIAASHIARKGGLNHAIALDMGGTTTKACLIENGQARTVNTLRVERLPVRAPVIDLIEISGGGGTLAWIDDAGLMRLGPRSAGAMPGPACYGRGGTLPTISDANAVLGYLSPDFFLGGQMRLDVDRAHEAIRKHLAEPLAMDDIEVALGILRIANSDMEGAIRLVTTRRGIDPRSATLIAFGGAGPLHAAFVAHELGMTSVLIPPAPGNVNAFGTLVANARYDYAKNFYWPLERVQLDQLSSAFEELEAAAVMSLSDLGSSEREQLTLERMADLRYVGQGYEITMPVASWERRPEDAWRGEMAKAFHEAHQAQYKYHDPDSALELVTIRLVGTLRPSSIELHAFHGQASRAAEPRGERRVRFPGYAEALPTRIYRRADLGTESRFDGPAIVEEYSATTVVPPGWKLNVDEHENLRLSAGARND